MVRSTKHNLDWYLSHFEKFEKSLNGGSQSDLHMIRRSAIARFSEIGFPTTGDEEWRFTSVAPIVDVKFNPVMFPVRGRLTTKDIEPFAFGSSTEIRLVFVNGHFDSQLSSIPSLPNSVKIGSLAEALRSDGEIVNQYLTRYARFDSNAFTALSTAFIQDGAFVSIPENVALEQSIHLLFVSTGDDSAFVSYPRNLIVAGNGCHLAVVESYVGLKSNSYFTNVVTEVIVGERASVEHDKLQMESEKAFHVGSMHVHMNAGSNFTSNSISLGGALVRNNVTAILEAEGSECTLNGLSLATGTQHIDNHTTIDHAKPHCNSHELYKSILDGKSKGVFNGKIFVRKDAQKTDAKQTNKTLLLSDESTIDTKPQLEIFADDVKCTHGATVGQLDEGQVFYLRARGIGLDDARDILTYAFASDVINRVHVEPLRAQLDQMIQARLRHGRLHKA